MRGSIVNNQKALTLMECLVAIVLLAVTLVAGMAFYFNSGAIMGRAMHKKMAMEMINQKMETIKQGAATQVGFDALALTDGFVKDDVTPSVMFGDFSAEIWKRVTKLPSVDIKQVDMEVRWIDSGKDQVIALSTYLAAP